MKSSSKNNFEQLYKTILENAEPAVVPATAPAAEPVAAVPPPTVSPDDPKIQKALSIILAYGAGKINNTDAADQIQALLTAPAEAPAAAARPSADAVPAV